MKDLLLLIFVFFELLSFSKEIIIIRKDKEDTCPDIKNVLINIIIVDNHYLSDSYFGNYAFNAQYCGAKKVNNSEENDCCYVSLSLDNNWYYFCGLVESKEFSKEYIETKIDEIKDDADVQQQIDQKKIIDIDDTIEKMKKGIQIDCFSKKLNFIKTTLFILLILII